MISFKVSELDLIALKQNSVNILNNTIMIVVVAKGTQGWCCYCRFRRVLFPYRCSLITRPKFKDHSSCKLESGYQATIAVKPVKPDKVSIGNNFLSPLSSNQN